jgi:hypothetical protein
VYWCSTSQRRSSLTLAGQRSLSSPAELLSLSNQYSAATAAAQRAAALAAGEAMVAVFHGTAFQVSYVLGSITGLLIAALMLLAPSTATKR